MQQSYDQPYGVTTVAMSKPDVRAEFIRKTYLHLAGAIAIFVAIEYYLLTSPIGEMILSLVSGGTMGMLILFGLFVGASFLANYWAHSDASEPLQYLGLGLFIVAEAIIFLPILYVATHYAEADVIPNAAIITAALFTGLTFVVFTTRKDFSFLGSFLMIGGFIAMGLIVASMVIGFDLGLIFAGAMVLLAAGSILYTTSNILHHYQPTQHVAASLALFASVAMLFYYILRIVMAFSRD